jgi:hypothetical protein
MIPALMRTATTPAPAPIATEIQFIVPPFVSSENFCSIPCFALDA